MNVWSVFGQILLWNDNCVNDNENNTTAANMFIEWVNCAPGIMLNVSHCIISLSLHYNCLHLKKLSLEIELINGRP